MKNKKIIALAAKVGAGKSFFTDYVREKYNADYLRFSDSLKETLDILDLERTRDNLQNLSKILRSEFGENILEKSILRKIKNSEKELLILDGVRRKSDIDYFLNLENFYLIYIDVDTKIRLERIKKRNEKEDDKNLSLEKLLKDEKHNSELQEEILDLVNFKIDNNANEEEFKKEIDKIMQKL